jgi:hypothetical protein
MKVLQPTRQLPSVGPRKTIIVCKVWTMGTKHEECLHICITNRINGHIIVSCPFIHSLKSFTNNINLNLKNTSSFDSIRLSVYVILFQFFKDSPFIIIPAMGGVWSYDCCFGRCARDDWIHTLTKVQHK